MTKNKILFLKPDYTALPTGIAYVLACLEENKISFDFIDVSIINNWQEVFNKHLKENKYLAVATGGLIGHYKFFQEIITLINNSNQKLPLILGGNITKDTSDNFLFNVIGITYGILGEAETSLPHLINALETRKSLENLPGLIYKNDYNEYIRNNPIRLNLENYKIYPAWHNFDLKYYIEGAYKPMIGFLKFISVLTGRGCIGKCTFCSPTIGGFRKRKIDDVIDEIVYLSKKYDFDCIDFQNEMFYPSARQIIEFCEKYKKIKDRKSWVASLRVDSNLEVSTFKLMKDAGCIAVAAGIESGSNQILLRMNKKTTKEQIRRFFKNAKLAGLQSQGTYIIGFEDETETDIIETTDFIIKEEIRTSESLMYIYPGTTIYDNACAKGMIKSELNHIEKITNKDNFTRFFIPDMSKDYFNMTRMDTISLFNIATREIRRYKTFLYNKYQVDKMNCHFIKEKNDIVVKNSGICKECGAEVHYSYNLTNLGVFNSLLCGEYSLQNNCTKCYSIIFFDIYHCDNFPKMNKHYRFLKEELCKFNKILICGMNEDALQLIRINFFDIDYDKIIGITDSDSDYDKTTYVNLDVIDYNSIVDIEIDCIITTNLLSDDNEKIKELFLKNDKRSPIIFHLSDNQTRKDLLNIM